MTLSWRKYFAAVLRDIPAFIAHMLIVFPWLRSLTSLVSWVLETTTSEQHTPPQPMSNSTPSHPGKPPRSVGSFNCRHGALLIVAAQGRAAVA